MLRATLHAFPKSGKGGINTCILIFPWYDLVNLVFS